MANSSASGGVAEGVIRRRADDRWRVTPVPVAGRRFARPRADAACGLCLALRAFPARLNLDGQFNILIELAQDRNHAIDREAFKLHVANEIACGHWRCDIISPRLNVPRPAVRLTASATSKGFMFMADVGSRSGSIPSPCTFRSPRRGGFRRVGRMSTA